MAKLVKSSSWKHEVVSSIPITHLKSEAYAGVYLQPSAWAGGGDMADTQGSLELA